jgi:putative endonuclease
LVDLPTGRQARWTQNPENYFRIYKLWNMFLVYAIKSVNREYIYVGLTHDLENRINRHNKGYEKTTRPYRPFELIYQESYETRFQARQREKYLKSGIGKEFLKSIS